MWKQTNNCLVNTADIFQRSASFSPSPNMLAKATKLLWWWRWKLGRVKEWVRSHLLGLSAHWFCKMLVCKMSSSCLWNSLFFYVNVNVLRFSSSFRHYSVFKCEPVNTSEALFWYAFRRTKTLKTFMLDSSNNCLWYFMFNCYFKSSVLGRESGWGYEESNFIGIWLWKRNVLHISKLSTQEKSQFWKGDRPMEEKVFNGFNL